MGLSAGRSGAGASAAACAAVMAFALALAGCGGKTDVKPIAAGGAEPLPTAAAMSGGPGASTPAGGQQQAGQPVAAPGPLDTSSWVIKPPFYAAGQEPYWRLQIDDGWFVFKRSGLPEIEAPMTQPKKVAGADVFETPPLVVTIKRGACETSEGQHGDISALVKFEDTDFDGCAYAGQLSQGVSAEASAVVDDIKVVDACLAKLGQPALVTSIYPREGGRTAAALKTKDGTLYECGVEPDGGKIAFLDEIEPGSEGAWMKKMRFLRVGQSDATKCDGAEEVKAGDKVLGRLLTAKCKF